MTGFTPLMNCRCFALLTRSWIRNTTKLAGTKDIAKMTQMDTRTSTDVVILKKTVQLRAQSEHTCAHMHAHACARTHTHTHTNVWSIHTHTHTRMSEAYPRKKICSPHIFHSGVKMIIFKQKKNLDNSNAKLLLLRSKRVHSQNKTIKGSLRVA